jgi:hypothetical protein
MLHTTIFGLEENDLLAHNGSIREGRNCFCRVYAMLRHRLAVKCGIEYRNSEESQSNPGPYALRNKKKTTPNATIANAQNEGECST